MNNEYASFAASRRSDDASDHSLISGAGLSDNESIQDSSPDQEVADIVRKVMEKSRRINKRVFSGWGPYDHSPGTISLSELAII